MADNKQLIFGDQARAKLLTGVSIVNDAVSITIGPKGLNAILDKNDSTPIILNDGVSISTDIILDDAFENIGAKLVIEASKKTNTDSGDGTSTSILLTHAILSEGIRNITSGASPVLIKKGIELAVEKVVEAIEDKSKKLQGKDDVINVAAISSGDPEIGQLIADALQAATKNGIVTVEDSKTMQTEMVLTEGMEFDSGFLSPNFVTNPEKMEAELEDPYILLANRSINNVPDIIPLVEQIAKAGKSLVIIADDIGGDVIPMLVINKMRNTLKSLVIKLPSGTDKKKALLEDMAVLTGAVIIDEEMGKKLENVTINDLGRAAKIRSTKDKTTIIDGAGDKEKIQNRINQINAQIENATDDFEKEMLTERLAKLSGKCAIIKVAALTDVELKDKKLRIEDALNSTKAAASEGVCAGGGTTLLSCQKALDDIDAEGDILVGVNIVRKALEAPIKQIALNSGYDPGVVLDKVKGLEEGYGFNAATGEYEDLLANGIIDAAKVERTAIQNASSIAGMMLTTKVLIANKPKKDDISEIPTVIGQPMITMG